jgi:hypothetical protein
MRENRYLAAALYCGKHEWWEPAGCAILKRVRIEVAAGEVGP